MSKSPKIGVIVEGKAEKAIFNILLNSKRLIIDKDKIILNNPCMTRNAKTYCDRNLKMIDNVIIIRILDSKNEKFKIPRAYMYKVKEIINVYTTPEIEMLIIHSEGLYTKYKSSKKKPSKFLKEYDPRKFSDCKSERFISEYFHNPEKLVDAINLYESNSKEKGIGFSQIMK